MEREELNQEVEYFTNPENGIGLSVYVTLKNDDGFTPKRLDIPNQTESDLLILFRESIQGDIIDGVFTIQEISSADERTDVLYEYDLEVPDELQHLREVTSRDDLPLFDLREDDLSQIEAVLVEIGNEDRQLVLFKKMYPVQIFSREKFFLKKSAVNFERIDDDFIRIDPSFHLFKLDERIFVKDLKVLERFFSFHEIIRREALAGLEAITELSLVSNIDALEEMIDDISFARKLTRVANNSPVLQHGIPNEQIISFSRTHPGVRGKIRYTEDQSQFTLDTKVSKNVFIKLLNDDFLTSQLTNLYYDSLAKDGIEQQENDSEQETDESEIDIAVEQ